MDAFYANNFNSVINNQSFSIDIEQLIITGLTENKVVYYDGTLLSTASTTTFLDEGANLYFTNLRARQALSLTGSPSYLEYNNTTGVFNSLYNFNQNLLTTSSVNFSTLNVNGTVTCDTSLTIDAVSINATALDYCNDINQQLTTSSSPTFENLILYSTDPYNGIVIGNSSYNAYLQLTASAGSWFSGSVAGDLVVRADDGSLVLSAFNSNVIKLVTSDVLRMTIGLSNVDIDLPLNVDNTITCDTSLTIDAVSINATALDYCNDINQQLTTTSTPTFSQLTLNGAVSQLTLSNGTSNTIYYNTSGISAPTYTTRSAGTKIVLYPNLSGSSTDYALGINAAVLWMSVPTTAQSFYWYAGTSVVAYMTGDGYFTLNGNMSVGSDLYVGSALLTETILEKLNNIDFASLDTSTIRSLFSASDSYIDYNSGTGDITLNTTNLAAWSRALLSITGSCNFMTYDNLTGQLQILVNYNQNLMTSSSPQFADLILTEHITMAGVNKTIYGNTSMLIGCYGDAVGASYAMLANRSGHNGLLVHNSHLELCDVIWQTTSNVTKYARLENRLGQYLMGAAELRIGDVTNPTVYIIDGYCGIKSNLRIYGSTSGYTEITTPATTTSYTITTPSTQGAANSVVQNDGTGQLSFATIPTLNSIYVGTTTYRILQDNDWFLFTNNQASSATKGFKFNNNTAYIAYIDLNGKIGCASDINSGGSITANTTLISTSGTLELAGVQLTSTILDKLNNIDFASLDTLTIRSLFSASDSFIDYSSGDFTINTSVLSTYVKSLFTASDAYIDYSNGDYTINTAALSTYVKSLFSATAPVLYSAGVISLDHNTTNLQISSGKLNTIQNIDTTSAPTFIGLELRYAGVTPYLDFSNDNTVDYDVRFLYDGTHMQFTNTTGNFNFNDDVSVTTSGITTLFIYSLASNQASRLALYNASNSTGYTIYNDAQYDVLYFSKSESGAGLSYLNSTDWHFSAVNVNINSSKSLKIGTADINETDALKLDGVTNGTCSASKCVIVDSNKDIASIRNISADTLTLIGAANQLTLNNNTSNMIYYNTSGISAPTFTSRSAGTKIVLYPGLGASSTDYALGIDGATLWQSIPLVSNHYFKWYAATTPIMTLQGDGQLIATNQITATALSLGHANSPTITQTNTTSAYIQQISVVPSDAAPLTAGDMRISSLQGNVCIMNYTAGKKIKFLTNDTLRASIDDNAYLNMESSGGKLGIDSVYINKTELGYLSGVTAGTITALKALVVDGNKDIASLRYLSATTLSTTAPVYCYGYDQDFSTSTKTTGTRYYLAIDNFNQNGVSGNSGTSRMTVDRTGIYEIQCQVGARDIGSDWEDEFNLQIEVNGTLYYEPMMMCNGCTSIHVIMPLNVNDYVKFCYYQNSGGDQDITIYTFMASVKLVN